MDAMTIEANSAPHTPVSSGVDLEACLAGDSLAWQAFMETYGPIVRKAVRWTLSQKGRRITSAADVDDVVQDVFVRLIQGTYRLLATYDPERSSLPTWLCVVSRSAALDFLRNRRHAGAHIALGDCEEPLAKEPYQEEAYALPTEILSPRQLYVLHCILERGMTTEEIARSMDVHPQTVRSLRHSAVLRLKGNTVHADE